LPFSRYHSLPGRKMLLFTLALFCTKVVGGLRRKQRKNKVAAVPPPHTHCPPEDTKVFLHTCLMQGVAWALMRAPLSQHGCRALIPLLPPQGCRSVEEFQCLNRIEEGTYGVVYRAKDKKTGGTESCCVTLREGFGKEWAAGNSPDRQHSSGVAVSGSPLHYCQPRLGGSAISLKSSTWSSC
jgi:hypothetical protein